MLWDVISRLMTFNYFNFLQIISSKHLEKDTTYRFLADLLGDGLITCSSELYNISLVKYKFLLGTELNPGSTQ